ncbi:hypothetical protein B0J18DRAFT_454593 [Chaetomium sp. MPI-SDFR-AT-0129]|uniref:Zn(2)-C6 fungal-type domain-containing protein n=1 Tax=Dichotomopilus funicola TaxID=1934379 RepID=A0AAN6V6N5_9PEZI|nr:hypothetical protein B0J18DRAFT_454593 [Chaetomium sp. MPI-SDFR-AT-0129]KAK4145722.1 hypothetical protein C8A04DRAFT_10410 [Dichotomopilus funicola]
MDSIPTPPNEEQHPRPHGPKRSHAVPKSVKTVHRNLKRTNPHHSHPSSPSRESHSQPGDGRHKRVWKACERCRMKKTKCDGEFPCKRCKDDGLICTAGTRKKTEYKQLPPGYAEVLENTQFVLIATVQKLYSMVRNGEPWDLGEPELNDRGQPIIHNVAARLGCLRPNSDLDLPPHTVFPEDEAGMAALARQLQEQAVATTASGSASQSSSGQHEAESNGVYHQTDRASSTAASDVEHSDLDHHEPDYRRAAFGGAASALSLSPASLGYPDFDLPPPSATASDGFAPSHHSPTMPTNHGNFSWLSRPASASMDFTAEQLWMANQGFMNPDVMTSGVMGTNYVTKPTGFSSFRNSDAMVGLADPVIFSAFEEDQPRPLFATSNM